MEGSKTYALHTEAVEKTTRSLQNQSRMQHAKNINLCFFSNALECVDAAFWGFQVTSCRSKKNTLLPCGSTLHQRFAGLQLAKGTVEYAQYYAQ